MIKRHTPPVISISLPISTVWSGERRLEGETYLTEGFQIRQLIEVSKRWQPLSELADVWQPSRLKGIQVAPQDGVPFLTATQVFDIRPAARKWLAPSRTSDVANRYLSSGWILVTCSGNVGDTIIAHLPHEKILVSHDLLRVQAKKVDNLGYLYTFLRTKFGRGMMRSTKYGSIIKHLEPEHLAAIPIPEPEREWCAVLSKQIEDIFRLRDRAFKLTLEAEDLFASHFDYVRPTEKDSFIVDSKELLASRRRLDGHYYNRIAGAALKALQESEESQQPLEEVADVFGVARFKHVYSTIGTPYLDSEDIFKINPEVTKFIPGGGKKNRERYFVNRNSLLMACSGQLYGLIGSVAIATAWHEHKVISNHVIRLVPRSGHIRPGYLQLALSHPVLGRPLVLRLAYGTEVPEIAPQDLQKTPIVRLGDTDESEIADRVEQASQLRSQADLIENEATAFVEEKVAKALNLKMDP